MKVYIFGANGMLGRYLTKYMSSFLDVVPITRKDVDLLEDFNNITDKYCFNDDDVIVNAAGVIKQRSYTANELIRVNSLFPHFLSSLKCHVIHVTTDCVFSGKEGSYTELSVHDCLDDYGKSKSLGEPNNVTVIRTSIIGEELLNKKSLVEWVKTNKNTTINGYLNHFWNGLTCLQLTKEIVSIINSKSYWDGVRHYHSKDTVSKYQLTSFINQIYNLNNKINPVMVDYCDRSLKTIYGRPVDLTVEQQLLEMYSFNIS
jgi:dTDP-4-dehydrorhamnose reductase|tara:strand:+ start:2979 stop:3755 length:777 start_codon:yes stop_codon:yes gene_type:complete